MVDIADADLPVFPFRVNWRNGITERLEWKTDILSDFLGNEQRRSLRLTPRREFEVTLSLWNSDRQFWDLWLHRMVGSEFLFPLWHDSVRSTQAAPQGQKVIWVDTRGLEFVEGSYGLLRGPEALSSERFLIAEVHEDRIVTASGLEKTWFKGTRVEPLVRGRLTDRSKVKALSSRVSESQVAIECTRDQLYGTGIDTWDQYQGIPVVTTGPNRSDNIDFEYQWNFSESDSGTGRRFRQSDQGRAFLQQKHDWWLKGRAAKRAFREFLYRVRGAAGPVWLPTFNEDLTLSRDNPAGNTLYVKAVGWAYTGGKSSGREYICIQMRGGVRHYRRITGTTPSGTPGEERLTLDGGLPLLPMAGVACVSYMDTARFSNDRFEFNHINAADGLTTVAGIMRTFRNNRQAPAILQLPIPAAQMSSTRCGADNDPCAFFDAPASVYEFRVVGTTWGGDTGIRGRPYLGDRFYGDFGQTGPYRFICGDPEWGGARVSYYKLDVDPENPLPGRVYNQRQGGGTSDCPSAGGAYWGAFKCYVKGDTWPMFKLCPAIRVGWGRQLDAATLELESGNFDDTGCWEVFPDYNDPRYLG